MFGLSLLTACADDAPADAQIAVAVAQSEEMDTVATVTWRTEAAGTSWIEFGDDDSYGQVTARTAVSTAHEVVLAGLPVAHTTHWRAVTETADEVLHSADQVIETRPGPSTLPELTLREGSSDRTDFLASTTISEHTWAFLMDRQARVVWYDDAEASGVIFGELTPSRDGKDLLYSVYPVDHTNTETWIARVSLDKTRRSLIPTPFGHHDFLELPEGGYAYLRIDVREIDGQPAVGDMIVEADAEGNLVREVWNAWDQITVPDQIGEDDGFYPQGWDWLHGNTLNYDEDRGVYLYSARAISTVYVVDRASGETLWSVGDEGSLALTSGTAFVGQHQPKLLDDGSLLLFDNTDSMSTSSMREYAVDPEAGTWRETWSYTTPEGQWAYLLGDADRLDDGATVMTAGTLGYLAEVDHDSNLTWRVDAAIGNILGFTEVLPHLGGTW